MYFGAQNLSRDLAGLRGIGVNNLKKWILHSAWIEISLFPRYLKFFLKQLNKNMGMPKVALRVKLYFALKNTAKG